MQGGVKKIVVFYQYIDNTQQYQYIVLYNTRYKNRTKAFKLYYFQ